MNSQQHIDTISVSRNHKTRGCWALRCAPWIGYPPSNAFVWTLPVLAGIDTRFFILFQQLLDWFLLLPSNCDALCWWAVSWSICEISFRHCFFILDFGKGNETKTPEMPPSIDQDFSTPSAPLISLSLPPLSSHHHFPSSNCQFVLYICQSVFI